MFLKINERILNVTKCIEPNIIFVGLIATLGFPAYYLIWHSIFIQPYENLTLRIIGTALFIPWLLFNKLDEKFKKNFPYYVVLSTTYALPFFFSFMLIQNKFSFVWHMSCMAGLFFLITIIYDWILILLMLVVGISAAILLSKLMHGGVELNTFHLESAPIYLFSLITGAAFNYKKKLQITDSKANIMKALGGSIAHEVRNPLSTVRLIGSRIKDLAMGVSNEEIKNEILELTDTINTSVKRANEVINLTLGNLRGDEIDSNNFLRINAADLVEKVLKEYGYKDEEEKNRIIFKRSGSSDFDFRGDESLAVYVVFNLIKNALYYSAEYSKLKVTITLKNDENFNYIIVTDTGPGIAKNRFNKIFQDFGTSGKMEGTGLGLPFCKRVMKAFGGDIEVESELKNYTKFTLSFPKIEQFSSLKTVHHGKKHVLIIDDEKLNLLVTQKFLSKHFDNIIFDTAENGPEALKMVKNKKYDLIITDMEMPFMDGAMTTKEIRKLNVDIPIIVNTALRTPREEILDMGMNDFVYKSKPSDVVLRIVAKWLAIKYEPLKNQSMDQIKPIFSNKNILLADDEEANLMIMSRHLKNLGANVDMVRNGDELLATFIEKTNQNYSYYDLVLTDIKMPGSTGDQSSRRIREYLKETKGKHVPIIAYSGNDDKEMIRIFLHSGMDDYFVKGDNHEYMARLIGFWIAGGNLIRE